MFCWHELVTAALEEAVTFYKELLGGTVESFPTPLGAYTLVTVEGQHVAGIHPAHPSHPTDAPSQWLSYVAVDDVDAAARAAERARGVVVTAPHDGGAGRAAIVRDRQGALHGLFTARPGATDGTNPSGHGAVGWSELLTSDVADAADFYASVLGWKVIEKEMGPQCIHLAHVGDSPIATILPRPAEDTLPHSRWCPYFEFESVENAVKRSRALGGREAASPMDVPGVGRWSPVIDAVGAEVAFIEWVKR